MALKSTNKNNQSLLSFISFLILLPALSYSQTDKLLQGQVLKDGEELVSAYGNFRLGFFRPYRTKNRYLGIYYKMPTDRAASARCEYCQNLNPLCVGNRNNPIQNLKPVWVGNRNNPILYNESASLTIDGTNGNLRILRNGGNPIEISSIPRAGNTSATLLKNGNFVLYEMNSDGLSIRRTLWQSFDYPTDTLLPGMKLGINLQTGHQWFLRSWRSDQSPSQGSYVIGMDPNVTNKLFRWKNEVNLTSRIWLNKSLKFQIQGWDADYNFSYTSNEQERYLNYSVNEDVTSFPLLRVDSDGEFIDDLGRDIFCYFFQGCDDGPAYPFYNIDQGGKTKWWLLLIISVAVVLGVCLLIYLGYRIRRKYFKAKEEKRWMSLVIVVGVASVVPLLSSVSFVLFKKPITKEEKRWMSLVIVVGVASVAPLLSYKSFVLFKKLKAKVESILNRQKLLRELGHNVSLPTIFGNRKTQANKDQTTKRDLKIFDFQTIAAATDNFSTANRLGQGGFGPVYKGKLLDGQEIAIKRLKKFRTRNSGVQE